MFQGHRLLIILNPASGRQAANALAGAVEAESWSAGAARVELRSTGSVDDAVTWSADAGSEGFDRIVVAGGDGTVTAVATGVMRSGLDLPIGIVPTGTGNGLARVLRIPIGDPLRAFRALAAGHTVAVDAVEVRSHDRWALVFLGAGLDAEINRDADAGKKRRYGFLAYVAAAGRNLLGRHNRRVALTLDGRTERLAAHTVSMINAGLITVAGIEVGPPADPHDGRLDVAVFRSPNPFGAAAQVWRLLTGRPTRAELLRAGEVRLTSDRPLLVHVDGDVVGTTPLDALVHRAAVSFIADATYVRPTDELRG